MSKDFIACRSCVYFPSSLSTSQLMVHSISAYLPLSPSDSLIKVKVAEFIARRTFAYGPPPFIISGAGFLLHICAFAYTSPHYVVTGFRCKTHLDAHLTLL